MATERGLAVRAAVREVSSVVAINGLGGLAYLWERLAAAMAPGYRLEVLDLAGHGDRPRVADYHYDALVEDVVERVASHRTFPLLGWSVGAAVAWLVAARHPDRVTHLVLIEPAAPHQSPFRFAPDPPASHEFTFASIDEAVQAIGAIYPTVTEIDVRRLYRQNAASRWEPRFDPAIFPALVEDAREQGEEEPKSRG